MNFKDNITPFVMLGDLLRTEGVPQEIAQMACEHNPLFTIDNIRNASDAIASQMLNEDAINLWIAPYSKCKIRYRSCAVIMAGNIPLVGFLDMMALSICGIDTYIKPSSKDRVLIMWIVDKLKSFGCKNIYEWNRSIKPEFVIATGSNNMARYIEYEFINTPKLIRSSRSSVAVISGDESDSDIEALWSDIFEYMGLGCRNVSHLFIPSDYDMNILCAKLSNKPIVSDAYRNSYLQNRALKIMNGEQFIDGRFFIATESNSLFAEIAEITYSRYSSISEVEEYIAANEDKLQCVVGGGAVNFGYAQKPQLNDWADGVNLFTLLLD